MASIVGLGAAAQLAQETQRSESARQQELRDELHALLEDAPGTVQINGHPIERLPNTLNIRFLGWDGNDILARTHEIAASTGSACHAGQTEPSSVLLAMGIPAEEAVGTVRLSLGRGTTRAAVQLAAEALMRTLTKQGTVSLPRS